MSAKPILLRAGQFVLLAVLYLVFFSVGGMLRNAIGPALPPAPADQQWMLAPGLLLVSIVDALLIMAVIVRSNWRGWRLMLGVAVSYYGVITVMSQIEVAYFGAAMGIGPEYLPGLFLQSLPTILLYIPLAVFILGKARPWNVVSSEAAQGNARLHLKLSEWIWKLALIAIVYVVLYLGFGFLVAWQNPELRALYGNGANQEVFNTWRLISLQLLRGVLWVLFVLPIIAMDCGPVWGTAVTVGLWLALPMNMPHAVPNPIMPDASVRLSHFVETSTSNFIFGVIITAVILWHGAWERRATSKHVTGSV